MHYQKSFRAIASVTVAVAAFTLTIGTAHALDESKYPNFSSQWIRIGGAQWDPSKPQGLKQQAPLTPEYQAIYEKSLAEQAAGGHGNDVRFTCRTSGMPRNMTAVYPFEIIIQPNVTYILGEYWMPRRIYTDGRTRPEIIEPAFAGYSTGKWIDTRNEYDCNENNNHVRIGTETYYLSADGFLMPGRKGQKPPDIRYFQSN
jgi:hypothetical protein